MRHPQRAAFDAALAATADGTPHARWHEVNADPNDPAVLARRAATLRAAWRPPVANRIEFLSGRCAGKRVLDIGCVAHDLERMQSPNWVHAHLARSAAECVGVDILPEGVAAMRAAGFDAVEHDLSTGLGPLAARAPFDVIVAGELFEHVASLDMLFGIAADALSGTGTLIITTPNPYAPDRVWAGQRGIVYENVDHIAYAFPSGVAELAERHGLRLVEAMTTSTRRYRVRGLVKAAWRALRGTHRGSLGLRTHQALAPQRRRSPITTALLDSLGGRSRRFVGETFVYVVGR